MKYFTPELLQRFASSHDAIADAAQAEWETAIERYHRYLARILPRLPRGVQRFRHAHLCLHDAQVVAMTRQPRELLIVLQLPGPPQRAVLLMCLLNGEPEIDRAVARGPEAAKNVTWLYEEWSMDRQHQCWFEFLLSNGWSIRLPLRNLQFRIGEPILTARHGGPTVVLQPA